MLNNNKVVTFGCRLNSYESEVMKDMASQAGLEGAIIVNTCAVTSEAERQAKQTIRKLRRENPDTPIIVTGCSAQIDPTKYSDMPEVTRVLGNDEKMHAKSYQGLLEEQHPRVLVNDIMSVKETALHLISGFEGKTRAFVQIQNGCNHRCTFCTIPYGRGNSRSVALGEIVQQVRQLLDAGYLEIVLTGVDITDYGLDLPGAPRLGQMIRRLLKMVPELMRLRLSSLDPVEIDEDLWELIETEQRLLPHLHLSLQAGADLILKRMKRRHLRDDVIHFCTQARQKRPDVTFGADIIVGFPTETDAHFQDTMDIVDACDLTFLHVFSYSKRPGTPAARMPQVDGNIIKERSKQLRTKGLEAFDVYVKRVMGSTQNILIERQVEGVLYGKNDHFAPVIVENKLGSCLENCLIPVTITGSRNDSLLAVAVPL